MAASVILPSWLAIALFCVGAIVTIGVVIAWLRHHGLDRRVDILEQKHRADQERDLRWEQMLQTVAAGTQLQNADLQNVKELLSTIIKGLIRDG